MDRAISSFEERHAFLPRRREGFVFPAQLDAALLQEAEFLQSFVISSKNGEDLRFDFLFHRRHRGISVHIAIVGMGGVFAARFRIVLIRPAAFHAAVGTFQDQ